MHWRMTALALGGAVACSCASAQPLAEDEDLALIYGDKSTFSLATGSKQSLRRAPAIATVITAEDIRAMGATDLDEVLESVPGLHVSRASVRFASLHFMRGIVGGGQSTPQVLFLQNGIPVTTLFNGDKGVDWVGVPVDNVARIEVIRGPGSALYGADAYAGVINVVTKSAAEAPGTVAGLGAGSFGSWSAWTQHGGTLGPLEVAAYLRVGGTDGFKKTIEADAQTRNDRLFGTAASLAPGATNLGYETIDASVNLAAGNWRAHAGYRQRDNMQTYTGVSSALEPYSGGRVEHFVGDVAWNDPQFATHWGLGATAAYTAYSFVYPGNLMLLPPGATLPGGTFPAGMIGGPNQWERQLRLSVNAAYSGFAGHSLRFGLGHDDLDLYRTKTYKNYRLSAAGAPIPTGPVIDYSEIQPFIRPQLRKLNYFFVQDEWNFAQDWALTAGLRHDRYSDFGNTTNPRLALVWDAALDLTAKLLYGQAFRAPSFNEQYGINPVANGNPSLLPETIRTLEAAVTWQARKDLQLNLGVFLYRMADLIRLVSNTAPAPGSTFQNTGVQRGRGLELEADWDAGRSLRLSGHYAFQRSLDASTGQDVGYAPRHRVYARADWRFASGWLVGGQLNRVTDRRRPAGDARASIADYTTLDLSLRSERGKGRWEFAASIRNLFAADVREPSLAPGLTLPNDLPLAPRSFYLQAIFTP
ncbi:MAG: TonB-dependent receptor [Rhodocyclales bacterium RIFCSPLOWO2_02_FULL_63_24]|nr:MAG: TonB-dependent receptor [Rhodocyclales bacterium GWA2_65_19]OHC72225.1 MAG: TonB-dependent receptor [Rhodocyclales bacterium RIFCSPLOWO2_02_FULL_63_24]